MNSNHTHNTLDGRSGVLDPGAPKRIFNNDETKPTMQNQTVNGLLSPNFPSHPKPRWIALNELRARRLGLNCTTKMSGIRLFDRSAMSSLFMIQRLQPMRELFDRRQRVICLNFSDSASLLCSGANDTIISVWDWQNETKSVRAKLDSGHESDINQALFCKSDTNLISASQDGTIRIVDIETTRSDQLMASESEIRGITSIGVAAFLTCGMDSRINHIDLRAPKQHMTIIKDRPLSSIESNPIHTNTIAVSGFSAYVALYDIRQYSQELSRIGLGRRCFGAQDAHLHYVTSIAFSPIGDKLLVSYNYEDLHLFDTITCRPIKKFHGHFAVDALTSCAWFGKNYVVSGSDCGHIYGWDLESGQIVCCLKVSTGIASTIRAHPSMPILASSGLDGTIEIIEPSSYIQSKPIDNIEAMVRANTMKCEDAKEQWLDSETNSDSDDHDSLFEAE